MKITTTNSFVHNSVRDYLNGPHHAMLTLHGHRGCVFKGLTNETVLLKSISYVFSSNICSWPHPSFAPMPLLLFLDYSNWFYELLAARMCAFCPAGRLLHPGSWLSSCLVTVWVNQQGRLSAVSGDWASKQEILLCKSLSRHLVGEDCCCGEDGISVPTNARSCFWHGMALCS